MSNDKIRLCIDCLARPPQAKRRVCRPCRRVRYIRRDPLRYAWDYHKQNAKKRGVPWELSLKEFKDLWNDEPEKKAEKIRSILTEGEVCNFEVDRIKARDEQGNNLPYKTGNVRIVTKLVNVLFRWRDHYGQTEWDIRISRISQADLDSLKEACPF